MKVVMLGTPWGPVAKALGWGRQAMCEACTLLAGLREGCTLRAVPRGRVALGDKSCRSASMTA